MKKVFAIIVCLWTVFGICGCGANPQLETEAVSSREVETVKGSKMESDTDTMHPSMSLGANKGIWRY